MQDAHRASSRILKIVGEASPETHVISHSSSEKSICDLNFHQPWCNYLRRKKSSVKEGLQRTRDVLLSDPFKKYRVKFSARRVMNF
jgi:hypothetical protein